jgi:hypothetical protein
MRGQRIFVHHPLGGAEQVDLRWQSLTLRVIRWGGRYRSA